MTQYRKKPVVIEAFQFDGTEESARQILAAFDMPDAAFGANERDEQGNTIEIFTLEGTMMASRGDYIIKGVAGEFYPCKADIFAATYDAVDTEAPAPALTPAAFSKQHLEPLMLKAHDHGFLTAGIVVEPEPHPDGDGLLAGGVASATQHGEQDKGRSLLVDLLRQQADLLEGQP